MPDKQASKGALDRYRAWRRTAPSFIAYVAWRFSDVRGWRMSAALGYTSLLAVVPLTAIAFAMLAAFPVFEGVRSRFQEIVFANFLPSSAEAMRDYLDLFVSNTATLSAVGIIGLAATAVLLLGTIEADLNNIFRVRRPRAMVPRLLVFWAMITLGPLLLGASFSLSTYFFAATAWLGLDIVSGPMGYLSASAPTLIIIVLLTVFYAVIPNRSVRWADAAAGAAVAGILFSVLRKVFGWYVVTFPTYQNVYGALSVVPIFLLWTYFSWTVVLLGAVITASIGEWRSAGGRPREIHETMSARLVVAVAVLSTLAAAARAHKGATRLSRLHRGVGVTEETVERLLEMLRAEGFVERTSGGGWVLAVDPAHTTLYELYRALGLGFAEELRTPMNSGWGSRLGEVLARVKRNNEDAMSLTLDQLLATDSEDAGDRSSGDVADISAATGGSATSW